MPNSTAILLAGGSGNRMQGSVEDKILTPLAGEPVISHSIKAFVSSESIQRLVIVCRDSSQQKLIEKLIPQGMESTFTIGGAQRQDSVWAGLQSAPDDTDIILVHDCARPCLTPSAIRESIDKAGEIGAACFAHPVTDTIKSADSYDGAYLTTTVDRSKLWAMETPQVFRYSLIFEAYRSIIESGNPITDDLSAIEDLDQPIAFIDNTRPNPKLTTPADLPYLEYLLASYQPSASHLPQL